MSANSRFPVSVHILAYLAYRQGHVVPSAEIAASVDTNPVVIRRLLAALVKGRLVATTKGSAGGFSLTRAPAEISLLDIQRAVEPQPANSLARFMPNPDCPVGAKIGPVLHQAFDRARVGMEAELARVSLGDVQAQLAAVCPGKKT